jgi:hypothetical protein
MNSPDAGETIEESWNKYQKTQTQTPPKSGGIPTANASGPDMPPAPVKVFRGTVTERRAKMAVAEASKIVGALTNPMQEYIKNPTKMLDVFTGIASGVYEMWYPGKIAKEEAIKKAVTKIETFYLLTGVSKPNDLQLENIRKYGVKRAVEMELEAQVAAGLMDAKIKERILTTQSNMLEEASSEESDSLDEIVK